MAEPAVTDAYDRFWFCEGTVMDHELKDFELEANALTKPGANSGIDRRTAFQPTGWPSQGYKVHFKNITVRTLAR